MPAVESAVASVALGVAIAVATVLTVAPGAASALFKAAAHVAIAASAVAVGAPNAIGLTGVTPAGASSMPELPTRTCLPPSCPKII